MKDAEPPADMFFTLDSVDLDGGVSSAVLVDAQAQERAVRLTATQRLGLDTYKVAALEHGLWEDGAFRGVHLDHWRDAFYRKHTGDTTAAKKKAFQRVRSDLLAIGKMTVTDDMYLACDPSVSLEIVMHGDHRDKLGHVPA